MFHKNTEIKSLFENCQLSVETISNIIEKNIGIELGRSVVDFSQDIECGGLRCAQIPSELAQFLMFIYDHRNEINNYVELGVYKAGTFYTVDSFLRATNPLFAYSKCVDKSNKMIDFIEYKEKYKTVEFVNAMVMKHEENIDKIDLCLIDADHRYEAVKNNFLKYKERCKYIAFHDIDIVRKNCNVKQLWDEIKNDYQHWEFKNTDPLFKTTLGIGVIKIART